MHENGANSPSGTRFTRRATEGEHVWVILHQVRAEKRDQYEQVMHEIVAPAVAQAMPTAYLQTRFLHPTEPNDDGSYTYIFLMDPVVEGVDYSIEPLLKQVYGDERAADYSQVLDDAMIGAQRGYALVQSRV